MVYKSSNLVVCLFILEKADQIKEKEFAVRMMLVHLMVSQGHLIIVKINTLNGKAVSALKCTVKCSIPQLHSYTRIT